MEIKFTGGEFDFLENTCSPLSRSKNEMSSLYEYITSEKVVHCDDHQRRIGGGANVQNIAYSKTSTGYIYYINKNKITSSIKLIMDGCK